MNALPFFNTRGNECITWSSLESQTLLSAISKKKKNVKIYNFFNELVIIKQRVIGVSSKKGWQGFNGL